MTTMTDEEAFALGVRAIAAGMQPAEGIRIITVPIRQTGMMRELLGDSARFKMAPPRLDAEHYVPDLRDPGTKGHAVAQLRERTGDPFLCTSASEYLSTNNATVVRWEVTSETHSCTPNQTYLTEEEAIVAAFEATKETP